MRFLNHDGRLTLMVDEKEGIDVERASGGALPAAPAEALGRWPEVLAWASEAGSQGDVEIDEGLIGPPSPHPRQIVGIGLNHAEHLQESESDAPEYPMIFAKLHASLAGPFEQVPISTATVDWEVELAVIIGRRARRVLAGDAWDHVAGLTLAQDLSERAIQMRPQNLPQFVLGKSLPGFCPTGPSLVTVDEFDDPDDVELSCSVNGEEVQRGRTSEFVYSVPALIEYLSGATELLPGDLILTGTPSGIGATREPPRFLAPGDVLESEIPEIGSMRQQFVADPEA